MFDFVVALFLLIVFSPILALTAFVILLTLGRPILFRQVRPGLKGRLFTLYKFRTMTEAGGSESDLLPDDARMTAVGSVIRRLSLDELPQLVNVVKGDLSLVGPRPLLTEYLPLYSAEQARRHDVKPGMTGWAQINGRNAIDWDHKLRLDVWYVDHRSFALDMRILWLTIVRVLKREGIAQEGRATIEKFKGSASC